MANLLKHNAASVAAMDMVASAAKAGTYEIREWDGAPGQPGGFVSVLLLLYVGQASPAMQTGYAAQEAPKKAWCRMRHQGQAAVVDLVLLLRLGRLPSMHCCYCEFLTRTRLSAQALGRFFYGYASAGSTTRAGLSGPKRVAALPACFCA